MEKITVILKDEHIASSNALKAGLELSQKESIGLNIVYIINDNWGEWYASFGASIEKRLKKAKVKELIGKEVLKYKNSFPKVVYTKGIKPRKTSRIDPLRNTDLVIVDQVNRQFGVTNVFYRSQMEKILLKITAPILTVYSLTENVDLKNIAFGAVKKNSLKKVVDPLVNLATGFNARIDFVAIQNPSADYKSITRSDISSILATKDHVEYQIFEFKDENLEIGMEHFAIGRRPDVVGVVSERKSRWYHKLWGSVSKELIQKLERPVLEIKAPKRNRNVFRTMYSVNPMRRIA